MRGGVRYTAKVGGGTPTLRKYLTTAILFLSLLNVYSRDCAQKDTVINNYITHLIDSNYRSINDSLIEIYWTKGKKLVPYQETYSYGTGSVYLLRVVLKDSFEHWYGVYYFDNEYYLSPKYYCDPIAGMDTVDGTGYLIMDEYISKRIIKNRCLGVNSCLFNSKKNLSQHLKDLPKPKLTYLIIPVY